MDLITFESLFNHVEFQIALVWRSSMRTPGILGWDREDEYMDWRDSQRRDSRRTELPKARPRRRSREDLLPDDSGASCEEMARRPDSAERVGGPLPLSKSRSTSSVDSWYEEAKSERRRRARNPSPTRDVETRPEASRIKRGTSVSPMTVENWKGGNSRWEPRTRGLDPNDLKTPFDLEAASVRLSDADEDRLRETRPDAVSDEDLPGYIGTLLVSVERAIERVSLDDLPFPCPSCRHADIEDPLLGCKCAADGCACGAEDCGCSGRGRDFCHTFEVAGIKHIDSDDEEEVRMGFGESIFSITIIPSCSSVMYRVDLRK